MNKIVVLKCTKCGKEFPFEIGTRDLGTLQDAIDRLPERDADKLLEAVNRMLMNKSEAQRTAFMMNNVDSFSMINYDAIGTAINLFDVETIRELYSKYTQPQIDKLNHSMALWEDATRREGFIAFDAIYFCRKCKKLVQGTYLKVRSVEDRRERVYLYAPKCKTCNSELQLVNDANMGYLFEGITSRSTCPACAGAKLVVSDIRFKP